MTARVPATAPGSITSGLETWSATRLAAWAGSPWRAALALIALVLALDLAGNLLLPPLDRTEVIYAQTAKQMLEAGEPGTWAAPAFQAEPKYEKPLVVLWLQAASAWATGQVDQIRGYRVPSILGTVLAVLFTYWGAARIFDVRVAFVGAALVATMLVVTVQATLAMPEALMLAATSAAVFALGRAYTARDDAEARPGNAFVFWLALGAGVLVNVITVPLIALLTALALVLWDRGHVAWMKRLASIPGILLFLVLAALWPLILWQAGTLGAALAQWHEEGLHLALGPQEMKWRVLPGLFVVFLLLGMFPAGLFLGPAILSAWRARATPAIRFLIAWVLPYLLFLELFTRKTPLYMVQAMLPPLAVLFAIWVIRVHPSSGSVDTPSPDISTAADVAVHEQRWFRLGVFGWLLLVIGLVAALWALPFLLKMWVSPVAILLGLATLALAIVVAKAMLVGQRLAAASSLIAMAVAFNNLTIPVTFAGLRPVWVSSEIRTAVDAIRPCMAGDVIIAGHTEPSTVFELGTNTIRLKSGAEAAKKLVGSQGKMVTVVGSAQAPAFDLAALTAAPACVAAYDFIRGCSHRFKIGAVPLAKEELARVAECRASLPARFHCENVPKTPMIGKMCK